MRDWNAKPVRISLDLSPEEAADLDRLVEQLGAKTKARLLRQMIRFYSVLARYKLDGYLIQAIRGGRLMQFPDLDVPYPQEVDTKRPKKV